MVFFFIGFDVQIYFSNNPKKLLIMKSIFSNKRGFGWLFTNTQFNNLEFVRGFMNTIFNKGEFR